MLVTPFWQIITSFNLPRNPTIFRRCHSLAITREDTPSIRRHRRSQLIPRARLIQRSSIKERYVYRELLTTSRSLFQLVFPKGSSPTRPATRTSLSPKRNRTTASGITWRNRRVLRKGKGVSGVQEGRYTICAGFRTRILRTRD